jgi:hypothetical protein
MPKYAERILMRMRAFPLIITVMALALFMAPALAADVTIPINKDYKDGSGMVVHLLQVSITDRGMGNVYSPDPENTVWPKLVFSYENKGAAPMNGNLEVAFFDDKGNQYPAKGRITDITMSPIQPGNTSDVRFVEAAVVPKDTKITSFKIYTGTAATTYDLPYGSAVTVTPTATPGQGNKGCAIAVILPLLAAGIFFVGKKHLK